MRDFDWGTSRRLASGRTLREWELVAYDKEIEIVPQEDPRCPGDLQ
jgi:hypothetical protein